MKKILFILLFLFAFTPITIYAKQKEKYIERVYVSEKSDLEYNLRDYFKSKIDTVTIQNKNVLDIKDINDYNILFQTKTVGATKVSVRLKNNIKITIIVKVVARPKKNNYIKEDLNKEIKSSFIYNPVTNSFSVISIKSSKYAYKNVNYNYTIFDKDNKIIANGKSTLPILGQQTYYSIYIREEDRDILKNYNKIKLTFDNNYKSYIDYTDKIDISDINIQINKENRFFYVSYNITNNHNKTLSVWLKYIYHGETIHNENNTSDSKEFIYLVNGEKTELKPNEKIHINQKINFEGDSYDTFIPRNIKVIPVAIEE